MSMIYRYGIQQRSPYVAPNAFIRDITVTDPSPELVQSNAFGIADCQAIAQANCFHLTDPNAVYRIIIFAFRTDTVNQQNNAILTMMSYSYMTKADVDKVLAEFDMEVSSVEVPKHRKHGHK